MFQKQDMLWSVNIFVYSLMSTLNVIMNILIKKGGVGGTAH